MGGESASQSAMWGASGQGQGSSKCGCNPLGRALVDGEDGGAGPGAEEALLQPS